MEKRGKFTLTSLEEMLDKHIGAVGTPERDQFDKDVDEALDKYNEETRSAIEQARRGESAGALDNTQNIGNFFVENDFNSY